MLVQYDGRVNQAAGCPQCKTNNGPLHYPAPPLRSIKDIACQIALSGCRDKLTLAMRLLSIDTLQLETFVTTDCIPSYAILSHTWGKDEVTFQDLQLPRGALDSKRGWKKITSFRDGELLPIFTSIQIRGS